MTNVEKIALHVLQNGPKSLIIHTVPTTSFWLVCWKKVEAGPNDSIWRIIICDPMKTTWRLVSDHVKGSEYLELWEELLKIAIGSRIKAATKLLR